MTTSTTKLPTWFWVVSGVALVWNIMGLLAFIGQVTMGPEAIAALPEEQQPFYQNTPMWATLAFAVAVICGTLGCVGLLMRKAWAIPVFIASLVGVLVQNTYAWFISGMAEVMGTTAQMVATAAVIIIAIFLIWFSRNVRDRGWIS